MKVHTIPFKETGYFSNLICDYLDKNEKLKSFYENFPDLEGFKNQIKLKENFEFEKREVLVKSLNNQNKNFNLSEKTQKNIDSLRSDKTFTITTGHQLNIFTGPLYFLYKIVSTLNLTKQLKNTFPNINFVPVYWMATEDHDFEEINYFNFKGRKVVWDRTSSGGVGRLETEGFDKVFESFAKELGNSINAKIIKDLFKEAYLEHENLTEATRHLVNKLFGEYGLVIVDGDDKALKKQFSPVVKDELLNNTSFSEVSKTNEKLGQNYNIQVNPREINLFYLKDNIRERIIIEKESYKINNTNLVFSQDEIIDELSNYPDRFSPNVLLRPVYQETILPNICYIGGGGELAYWFQLKDYFNKIGTSFPILLLRNSVLLASEKQLLKLNKLNVSKVEMFNKQELLIDKKVKEISAIKIDFSQQKEVLESQFKKLKEVAELTDTSFIGAVLAQEKKQMNGLAKLEKRLLKAQKRKYNDTLERLRIIQDELFPNQSLEERTRNFSEIYLDLGEKLIPMLFDSLEPLKMEFIIIEY